CVREGGAAAYGTNRLDVW
nr:immunoglobulin heavy chain junction region [Macaca mulatta]MOW23721.1 immunoglobulin heavy chain junction region [Macaca mulatta]MOW24770.1 immunoglobulin heavy chain junction region [Macaca mulatta]MOW24907.1 immunoglobulin heavy chain junction region [Macaca mulatta]MOW25022.1 immunoglobulin heavy chain junction region [Macaca mulatta]